STSSVEMHGHMVRAGPEGGLRGLRTPHPVPGPGGEPRRGLLVLLELDVVVAVAEIEEHVVLAEPGGELVVAGPAAHRVRPLTAVEVVVTVAADEVVVADTAVDRRGGLDAGEVEVVVAVIPHGKDARDGAVHRGGERGQ